MKDSTYALFGKPVAQSLSPLMHNAAFSRMGLRARYVPFEVDDIESGLELIRRLGIRGASVTLPYKTEVVARLDEVDACARMIGAVNTIRNEDGRLAGYNTDWIGFTRDLREHLTIEGKTFAVVGSGGAARAVVFGLLREGGRPVVLGRSVQRGESLARVCGCPFRPLREIGGVEAECLINATPLGMHPHRGRSPVAVEHLSRFRWVVDVIYNPLMTRLLLEARQAGCSVVEGVGMFVQQGAEQIRIWTGREPPVSEMKKIVRERLGTHAGN